MEDDERRHDEERHRRERVPRAELEPEILPGERGDVAEIGGHACPSAMPARRERRDTLGSCVATTSVLPAAASGAELRVEQCGAVVVERRVRLVEHDEVGLVEQGPAERETLRHAP